MGRYNSINRRKSTLSVHSRQDSIGPEIARQQAHVAAAVAFARGQERNFAEMGDSSNSTSSRLDRHNSVSQQGSACSGERVLRRQQSVRFAGAHAIPRKQSFSTRVTQNAVQQNPSTAALRPMAMTTNAPVPAVYRPPSRSSSIGKGSTSKATGDGYATALAAYDEYYTREDDIISTPSSYRKIRRSKSMYSPRKGPHVFYVNGTPDRTETSYMEQSMLDSRTPQNQTQQAPLRAPKSMSFLRSRISTAFRERNDEAVQKARGGFFHHPPQQRLREQPSFLHRSRAPKPQKSFRQSVRSSSANSYGMSVSSANQPPQPKESVLGDKARKVSKSIKNKLKRVLGFNKIEPVAIPNQQVDAQETHFRNFDYDTSDGQETFSSIPHPDEAALARVASRIPSIRITNSNEMLNSHCGSIRSLRSEQSDDKSRVTSWNSTVVNTAPSQGVRGLSERDQQRLSIINEHGTHISASSFNRSRVPNQFSAYPVIHPPTKTPPGFASAERARLYSTLMHRLHDSSPEKTLEAARLAKLESTATAKQIPARISSSRSSRGTATTTIRRVPPSEATTSSKSPESTKYCEQAVPLGANPHHVEDAENQTQAPTEPIRQTHTKNEDDIFSSKPSPIKKQPLAVCQPRRLDSKGYSNPSRSGLSCQDNADHGKSSRNDAKRVSPTPEQLDHLSAKGIGLTSEQLQRFIATGTGLTPQQLAHLAEPVLPPGPQRMPVGPAPRKALRESRSTFFGGGAMTIARATSPFRLAMAEENLRQEPLTPNPLLQRPKIVADNASDDRSGIVYSESVYSRSTGGRSFAPAASTLSLLPDGQSVPEMPLKSSGNGDAVIIERAVYRPTMWNESGHRATESRGPVEWKKWMSCEVSKLESAADHAANKGTFIRYVLPSMPKSFNGHIRESAQINDDDTDIAQQQSTGVKQPLGLVQQNQNIQNPPLLKPILKNRSAVSLLENIEPADTGRPPIAPPPPPIPVRSPIRTVQSRASLRSIGTPNSARTNSAPNSAYKTSSMSGKNLLHKRNASSTTLRSTKSVETPAKLVKKHGRPLTSATNTPSSTGGIAKAVEKQFGTASTRSRIQGYQNENEKMADSNDEIYGPDGAGLMGPGRGELADKDAQTMGSLRLVEQFLNSRRKRLASGSEDGTSVFI